MKVSYRCTGLVSKMAEVSPFMHGSEVYPGRDMCRVFFLRRVKVTPWPQSMQLKKNTRRSRGTKIV